MGLDEEPPQEVPQCGATVSRARAHVGDGLELFLKRVLAGSKRRLIPGFADKSLLTAQRTLRRCRHPTAADADCGNGRIRSALRASKKEASEHRRDVLVEARRDLVSPDFCGGIAAGHVNSLDELAGCKRGALVGEIELIEPNLAALIAASDNQRRVQSEQHR